MEKKYVMAKINLPLHILPNGTIEPMPEYVRIDIEPCIELPDKKDTSQMSQEMNQKIFSFCNILQKENQETEKEGEEEEEKEEEIKKVSKEEKPLFVLKEEIESYSRKPKSNQHTLKVYRRHGSSMNKTAKRYSAQD
jgi:hypothetical protein